MLIRYDAAMDYFRVEIYESSIPFMRKVAIDTLMGATILLGMDLMWIIIRWIALSVTQRSAWSISITCILYRPYVRLAF